MRKWFVVVGALVVMAGMALTSFADMVVSDLNLRGEIEGENIVFDLTFDVVVEGKDVWLPLVVGDVAYLESVLPKNSELVRNGNEYKLKLNGGGGFWSGNKKQSVRFKFASRPQKNGDWRNTAFQVPAASIRKIAVVCDRNDLKVRFPGALNIERTKIADNKTEVTAYLGVADKFEVGWKPEVKRLDSELVVACEANTIATASVGAMRLDTVFTYRIIQGSLEEISLALPKVSVTQVTGEDIQGWRINRDDPANPKLVVSLSRFKEGIYQLRVESEVSLPKFPLSSTLPVLAPLNVIRTGGFLMIGTDSAIKLQVAKAGGLTQVDLAAFPTVATCGDTKDSKQVRRMPSRGMYAYQFANMPYTLDINADDIVTTFTVDNQLVLSLNDDELVFDASVQIDIKDAPAREIRIETDAAAEWTVTSISGQHISEADADVRDENGKRIIYVPFKQAVSGTVLVSIRMERSLKRKALSFSAPRFVVLDAKSERGYIVVSAEKGIRLKTGANSGLREVHTGSAKVRVLGAQQAFRFKKSAWSLVMDVERTLPSIDSDLFHLISLGEGVMYCSAAVTYHISGAPVQEFKLRVPESIETVEFTGADIEGWQRDADICTVRLQTKVIGDYTLLVTFDTQFDYNGAVISVGGIETVGIESEVGYIAVASSASLELLESENLPGSIIEIDRDEIPSVYSSPVNDPIIKSYKYVKNPHAVSLRIQPLETEPMLEQVADYVKLVTRLSKKGGAVTTGTYYIKNASRQHLVVQLPDGVDLWSIKHVDKNGVKTDVLSQEDGNQILIPVNRPQDPDTAIAIELIYAQSLGELSFMSSGLKGVRLDAPTLLGTHATFASWNLKSSAGFSIVAEGGNMSSAGVAHRSAFSGVLHKCWRMLKALCSPRYNFKRALSGGFGGGNEQDFIRSVNLAGERPLSLKLSLVPAWMGANSSPRLMVGGIAGGLVVFAIGLLFFKSRIVVALGLTAIIFGTAQGAGGRSVLAICVWVLIINLVLRYGKLRMWGALAWKIFLWALDLLGKLFSSGKASKTRSHARKQELKMASCDLDVSPFENEESASEQAETQECENNRTDTLDDTLDGYISLNCLMILAMAGLLLTSAFSTVLGQSVRQRGSRQQVSQQKIVMQQLKQQARIDSINAFDDLQRKIGWAATPTMDLISVKVSGPKSARDAELSAQVEMKLEFEVDKPETFVVIPNGCVMTDYDLNSRYATIKSSSDGYVLVLERKGKQRITLNFRVPVVEDNGSWSTVIPLLRNMRNKLTLSLPEKDMDITAGDSVLLSEKDGKDITSAEMVFGQATKAAISWRPRIRKTSLEEVLFFTEVNTFASLLAGVVDLTHVVRFQIAQGELKELKLLVPKNMSVTAVDAQGLATWSFDPDTHLLKAILRKAVSGNFVMSVQTQLASDGLPYSTVIGALDIQNSSRQRGSLAVAAPGTVQVRIDESDTVNPMNIEDFSAVATRAAQNGVSKRSPIIIRRAFRYDNPAEVAIATHAEQVLPEIRVKESGALSVGDERIMLSTKIELSIAKAGIFSVRLGILADYDVESLAGRDVSHWDEITDGATEDIGGGRGVTVYFNRYVADRTEINLVVARMEKGIEAKIRVPRVHVAEARKHSGRLTIDGERGVRMMVESQRGVDIKKASELNITQPGVMVFDILRPTWNIDLKTEVLEPLVKPEVLQVVDLTEGMLKCKAFVNYKIENAGIKVFRLQSPKPGVALAVTGHNIARVHEVDKENGIWQIELHKKVINNYHMTVGFQIQFNHEENRVNVAPLKTLDTETQRGYLAVTCAGRVQVLPDKNLEGLKQEDPRRIPKSFKSGDLSDAILCYRTVRPDYVLPLSVVRHDSASVLPASISQVRMTSVLSGNRKIMTRLALELSVGDLRFLRMKLPRPKDALWTVLVNGREVSTSRKDEFYCIPLEEQEGKMRSSVEIVYAGSVAGGKIMHERKIIAPSFDGLPLNDIKWSFFVLPQSKYYGFGGSMDLVKDDNSTKVFNAASYQSWNKQQRGKNEAKARNFLHEAEKMAKSGRQKEAKKNYKLALNSSLGNKDLSEDARVQWRNVTKQQFKMGLVNRRNAVRYRNNLSDVQREQQMVDYNGGNFSQEYVQSIEGQLAAIDNDALEVMAEKMMDQQAAAAGVVKAIRIVMPEHGKELKFARALQIDPTSELSVTFKVSRNAPSKLLGTIIPILLIFAGIWGMLSLPATKKVTVEG